jgi:anti-anti-sigma factor
VRLQVEVRPSDSSVLFVVDGQLDDATAPTLSACATAADAPVVLDLSGVTRIDTSGVACLLRIREELAADLRSLRIRATSSTVRRALRLSGADAALGLG